MSFPYLGETKELNESTRKGAAGSFIALTDGVTHYEIGGDPDGASVVLTHGFSVPYFIFEPTFDFLCESGFRVLRYDLFGRGLSDRPPVNYDILLFTHQLADLLNAIHFVPVSLVGLSMGGPITAAFTAQYPELVHRHVLIDPAGAKSLTLPPALTAALMPGIGELVFGLAGSGALVRSLAADFFDPALVEEFQAKYTHQMHYKGFKRAILSTMRNGMLDSFYNVYEHIGKLKKPTLLVWGCNDTTVPFEQNALIRAAIPHAEFHAVEDCGHIPHYEKPGTVNPILREFLER